MKFCNDKITKFQQGNPTDFSWASIEQSTFNSTIDDLRIYNRALTAEEVKRLYRMGHMN